MAKLKTYNTSAIIWPDAARAVDARKHVNQVHVYFAAPTKKAAEEHMLGLGIPEVIVREIIKASRVNDRASAVRELKAEGHLEDTSVYVSPLGWYGAKGTVQAVEGGFEPIPPQKVLP